MPKPSLENLRLIVGTLNYSSWSVRPWILMKHHNIPFEEDQIYLHRGDWKERILNISGAGTVPILMVGDLVLSDSLSICEFLAEANPDLKLWPENVEARALARSAAAEMHSGFSALRTMMPMDIVNRYPGMSRYPDVAADVQRIKALWQACLAHPSHTGPFLFGEFGIVDAMYVPVIARFRTHGVELHGELKAYSDAILAIPAFKELEKAAQDSFEAGGPISAF